MPTSPVTSSLDIGRSALIRLPAVVKLTGLARSTIYKHVALKQFPQPVTLVGRAVAWRLVEIQDWADGRPAAKQRPRSV